MAQSEKISEVADSSMSPMQPSRNSSSRHGNSLSSALTSTSTSLLQTLQVNTPSMNKKTTLNYILNPENSTDKVYQETLIGLVIRKNTPLPEHASTLTRELPRRPITYGIPRAVFANSPRLETRVPETRRMESNRNSFLVQNIHAQFEQEHNNPLIEVLGSTHKRYREAEAIESIPEPKRRRRWIHHERQTLRDAVRIHGDQKWSEVSMHLQQHGYERSSKQCRERYRNHDDPKLKDVKEWTPVEDQAIIELYSREPNHWAIMAQDIRLCRRAPVHIRNRYNWKLKGKTVRELSNNGNM